MRGCEGGQKVGGGEEGGEGVRSRGFWLTWCVRFSEDGFCEWVGDEGKGETNGLSRRISGSQCSAGSGGSGCCAFLDDSLCALSDRGSVVDDEFGGGGNGGGGGGDRVAWLTLCALWAGLLLDGRALVRDGLGGGGGGGAERDESMGGPGGSEVVR